MIDTSLMYSNNNNTEWWRRSMIDTSLMYRITVYLKSDIVK